MKKIAVIRAFCITLAFILMMPVTVSNAQPDHRRESNTANALYAAAEKAAEYKKSLNSDLKGGFLFDADFLKSAENPESVRWLFAFSALGFYDDYNAYGAVLKDSVIKRQRFPDKKASPKLSELHTEALGLMACGINPNEIDIPYSDHKINLIKESTWGRNKSMPLDKDGVDGLLTALLTLDGVQTIIPESKETVNTRESIITKILSMQNEDGSFSSSGNSPSIKLTAQAAAALAPYKNSETVYNFTSVKTKNDTSSTAGGAIFRALSYLSNARTQNKDYSNSQNEVKDTACVITALCALGLNPEHDERFTGGEKNLTEILLSHQNKDGSFSGKQNDNDKSEATSYAVLALAAQYKFIHTGLGIYNFTDNVNAEKIRSLISPNVKEIVTKSYSYESGLLSSDDYEEIVILTDRAENSLNAKNNIIYIKMLRDIGDKLYKTREEIHELNAQCEELLLPQTVFGTKNLHEINVLTRRYNALTEEQKSEVKDFDKVIQKKDSMHSRTSVVYIFIGFLGLLAIGLVIFLAVFLIKSSPLLDYFIMKFSPQNTVFDDDDDEFFTDPEEFSEEQYDTPLPYEDDDEFFEYTHDNDDEEQNDDDDFKIY